MLRSPKIPAICVSSATPGSKLLDLMMPWLSLNVIWYVFPLRLPANVMPSRLTTNSYAWNKNILELRTPHHFSQRYQTLMLQKSGYHHHVGCKLMGEMDKPPINWISSIKIISRSSNSNQPKWFLTSPWFLLINPSTSWWSWLTPIEAAGWSFPKVTWGYVQNS